MFRLILIELTKRRTAVLGWGLGLGAFAALILSIAPDLAAQFSQLDLQDIAIYRAFGITQSIDSAASLIAIYMPFFGLILAVYGTITGANALAGEEDNGTLEMLLSAPVPRYQLVLAKIVAIAITLALVCLITFLGFVVTMPSVRGELETNLTTVDFLNVSLEMWPLAFFFAMLGLWAGAYLPRRGHAMTFGLAALIGTYLFNNLGQTVGSAAIERLLPYQPFHYYLGAEVITKGGVDYGAIGVLVAAAVVVAALALLAFQRRNVTVGAWPWQRPRPA